MVLPVRLHLWRATCITGTLLVDCFTWTDPTTAKPLSEKPPIQKLGGGGLYALVGARIWLGSESLRILVEGGTDGHVEDENPSTPEKTEERFPEELRQSLNELGEDMWAWKEGSTLKASIEYFGDERT